MAIYMWNTVEISFESRTFLFYFFWQFHFSFTLREARGKKEEEGLLQLWLCCEVFKAKSLPLLLVQQQKAKGGGEELQAQNPIFGGGGGARLVGSYTRERVTLKRSGIRHVKYPRFKFKVTYLLFIREDLSLWMHCPPPPKKVGQSLPWCREAAVAALLLSIWGEKGSKAQCVISQRPLFPSVFTMHMSYVHTHESLITSVV